jgi:hypothetical protein
MMAFTEVSGPAAFHAVKDKVHPLILEMWGLYREYAMYFLRYRDGQHTSAQIGAAQDKLLQYAVLAEQNLRGKLLTVQLHHAVVHIPEQARAIGPTAWFKEDFLERSVRQGKAYITNHLSRNPAQDTANICLRDLGLELCKVEHPDIDAGIKRPVQARATCATDETDEHGVSLLGALRDANERQDNDEVRSCGVRTLLQDRRSARSAAARNAQH